MDTAKTWLIIGASRGIGLEFVRQIVSRGDRVIATTRGSSSGLDTIQTIAPASLEILTCDVSNNGSITGFIDQFVQSGEKRLDYVVINAGILKYPNRTLEMSFDHFADHLHTNTVGPIIVAQKLLQLPNVSIGTMAFMSSDSGSAGNFLAFEDGYAAYAASKAALNQALRHMAEELKRKESATVILALHPGEVATDMSNIEIPWEISGGQITATASVTGLIKVLESKTTEHSGTFWTWENKEYPW